MAFVVYLAFVLPIDDWSDTSCFDTGIKVKKEVPESLQRSANNVMASDVYPVSTGSIGNVVLNESDNLTIGDPTARYINDFAVQLDEIEADNNMHEGQIQQFHQNFEDNFEGNFGDDIDHNFE